MKPQQDDELYEEEDAELPVKKTRAVKKYLRHLALQEEWADTDWLPEDFK